MNDLVPFPILAVGRRGVVLGTNAARPGGSAIDSRTTRHVSYAISQKKRKRIEECFGWLKDIALLRKLKHRGLFNVGWIFTFASAAYNLVRMRKLIPVEPAA